MAQNYLLSGVLEVQKQYILTFWVRGTYSSCLNMKRVGLEAVGSHFTYTQNGTTSSGLGYSIVWLFHRLGGLHSTQ